VSWQISRCFAATRVNLSAGPADRVNRRSSKTLGHAHCNYAAGGVRGRRVKREERQN
jgi:hypothetical protein